jgi:uncharacterized protein (TIGR03085 family)
VGGTGTMTAATTEQLERDALRDLFLELGPDAPTLCDGWTTSDIAVHLVVCEARPHAWLAVPMGDRVPALRRYFDRMVEHERARGWAGLVGRVRSGAAYGPTANAWFRDRMMFREFLVHHEDVRRANGRGPRTDVDVQQERAWQKVPSFAKRMLDVKAPYGMQLVHPDGRTHTVREGSPVVQLTGEPIEQLLYVFGRTGVARVDIVGDADALRVRDTSALAALPRVRGSDHLTTGPAH